MFGIQERQRFVLSEENMTKWEALQEILGYEMDTARMRISLPERLDIMRRWPSERKAATVKKVLSSAGKVHHAACVKMEREVL